MKPSRVLAFVILLGAIAWIGSGVFGRDGEQTAALAPQAETQEQSLFRVAVLPVTVENHARRIVLSGRTEADRRVNVIARADGTIEQLNVRRGAQVKTGDILAVISDEAREALVAQAKATLEQRRTELRARLKLIEQGNLAPLQKPQLEAELRAAEASLAQAETELSKNKVRAPIDGMVIDVPVETGQPLQIGAKVAEIIGLDPMLAVVEIAERQLGGIAVGDTAKVKTVNGVEAEGRVRFISAAASAQTRTYRVDIELANPDGRLPDGVTCDVILELAPEPAAHVPRSALTFSAEGRLGVRVVGAGDVVAFVPVRIVEDGLDHVWLGGLETGQRVIVQGQDFVKEGQRVTPVEASATVIGKG